MKDVGSTPVPARCGVSRIAGHGPEGRERLIPGRGGSAYWGAERREVIPPRGRASREMPPGSAPRRRNDSSCLKIVVDTIAAVTGRACLKAVRARLTGVGERFPGPDAAGAESGG